MVRACLLFHLLVMIACVGSVVDLQCFKCGRGGDDCPSTFSDFCRSEGDVCVTEYNFDGKLKAKFCTTEDEMKDYKHNFTYTSGDNCYSENKNEKAKRCFCGSDKCNKDSSSMIKPSVWTILLWIGLVLASAFSSRMRAV